MKSPSDNKDIFPVIGLVNEDDFCANGNGNVFGWISNREEAQLLFFGDLYEALDQNHGCVEEETEFDEDDDNEYDEEKSTNSFLDKSINILNTTYNKELNFGGVDHSNKNYLNNMEYGIIYKVKLKAYYEDDADSYYSTNLCYIESVESVFEFNKLLESNSDFSDVYPEYDKIFNLLVFNNTLYDMNADDDAKCNLISIIDVNPFDDFYGMLNKILEGRVDTQDMSYIVNSTLPVCLGCIRENSTWSLNVCDHLDDFMGRYSQYMNLSNNSLHILKLGIDFGDSTNELRIIDYKCIVDDINTK